MLDLLLFSRCIVVAVDGTTTTLVAMAVLFMTQMHELKFDLIKPIDLNSRHIGAFWQRGGPHYTRTQHMLSSLLLLQMFVILLKIYIYSCNSLSQ